MIKPHVHTLKNESNKGKNRRKNILDILNNIESSLFEGLYFHYKDKSLETKESIAERTNWRRQRLDEIAKKGKR